MVRWRMNRGIPSDHADAWAFYQAVGERDRTQISDVEREFAAICDLRQEVNSGGFDVYFRCWGGSSAPLALDALPRVLDQAWADVLRAAMALLGPEYPEDVDRRRERLDERKIGEVLSQLDERYFDLEASIDADVLVSARLGAR
jgi:hypothetical protein